MSEIASDAPAPIMASVLGSRFGSADSTMAITCALVHEAFWEQRPDGPVNQPAGEDFLLRRAPLALDEAAGKFSRGVSVFAIIDSEREERGVGLGFFIRASAD